MYVHKWSGLVDDANVPAEHSANIKMKKNLKPLNCGRALWFMFAKNIDPKEEEELQKI